MRHDERPAEVRADDHGERLGVMTEDPNEKPATRFRRKDDHDAMAFFGGYNYHGLGEFIAQFPEGDASSEYIKDWEPVDGAWPEERS